MTQPQLKIQATLERRRHQDNVVGPGDSNLHTYSRDNLSRVVIGSIDMATEKAQLVGRQEGMFNVSKSDGVCLYWKKPRGELLQLLSRQII